MSKKAKLLDTNYQVELAYGEIHLLLQAMDTLIDQNDKVMEYKSALSIYQKLESMHARISLERQDLIRQGNNQENSHQK